MNNRIEELDEKIERLRQEAEDVKRQIDEGVEKENNSNFKSLMDDITKLRRKAKYRVFIIAAVLVLIALAIGVAQIVSLLTPLDLMHSWVYWFCVNAFYLYNGTLSIAEYILLKEKVKDAID